MEQFRKGCLHARTYSGEETQQKNWEITKSRGRTFICFLFNEGVICGKYHLHGIAQICIRVHTVVGFTRSVKILNN